MVADADVGAWAGVPAARMLMARARVARIDIAAAVVDVGQRIVVRLRWLHASLHSPHAAGHAARVGACAGTAAATAPRV